MSKLPLLLSCCGLLVGLTLAACEGPEGGECDSGDMARVDDIIALTADTAAGQTAFNNSCGASSCHGSNGDSGPAPNLSNEANEFGDDALLCLSLSGYGDMPSQDHLSDQQLADLLAYIRATF